MCEYANLEHNTQFDSVSKLTNISISVLRNLAEFTSHLVADTETALTHVGPPPLSHLHC